MEAEAGQCLQSIEQEKMEGVPWESETFASTATEAQFVLVEKEPCKCKCQQGLMQALEKFKDKATALEEIYKRSSEIHESQGLEWKSERERFLELVSELESNSNEKDEKAKGLQERLSLAECNVEQLAKSRAELFEEVSRMQLQMGQAHDKLMDSECMALSLQKMKENEIELLSVALNARNIAFENVQADIADKERMINELSTQVLSLQDVQQQYALLQQHCLARTEDLQRLSESQKDLKCQLEAAAAGHEREMNHIAGRLQEALDSHASKDFRIEALTNELNGLQLALENVKAFNTKADLESCRLQEDLTLTNEAQYNNQLALEKALNELAALKDAVMTKDDHIASLKAQQNHQVQIHQQKEEAFEKDLQHYISTEKELLISLEQEQRKVIALEDLRKKELQAAKIQESSWRDDREKLIRDVSSMHNLLESRERYVQEFEEKLLKADDAIRHVTESRAYLQEENSELHMQVQKAQIQLRDAESALELVKKSKEDKLASLSNLLQAKLRNLETAQQETAQHQKTISAMATELANFQELQQEHAFLKETLRVKEEEVHALSKSQEKSRLQLTALEDEYHKDNNDLIVQLEKALECKARSERNLEECKNELSCLRVALEKTNVSRTESEIGREKLLDNLKRLQEENLTLQDNLHVQAEHSRKDREALKGSLYKKENELKELKQQSAELEGALSRLVQQEKQWQETVAECEALRQELKQKDLLHIDLHELHQKALSQWAEKENTWLSEKEILNSQFRIAEENFTVTNGKLQTALSDLQCLKIKYTECEQKMTAYEGEIGQLQIKLDESDAQIRLEKREFLNIQDRLESTSSTLTTLLQERESALAEANKKLRGLEAEMLLQSDKNIVCTDQIEFLKKESQLYEARIKDLTESVANLKKRLLETREESSRANEMKEAIEANLSNTKEELRLSKREYELQREMLGHAMTASEGKLQQALESLQKKEKELEALLKCLEKEDSIINELKVSNTTLKDEKEVLNQVVNTLQAKVEMHALAIENEKSLSQQLCSCVEEKDRTIASKLQEVRDLEHLLNLSKSESQKVNKYEEKLKNLEHELAEASASLHEKDERLIASEWAVQQLANEIAKAKSNLSQKEREEVLLQSRLSDMETRFKAKDKELLEIDCYVQNLVKKNLHKQSEVDRLTQAVEKFESRINEWNLERQELMSEIGRIGRLLEDKVAEMVHLEEQLEQRQLRENMMEDALQCLKSQLADRASQLDEQESKSKQLIQELETVHTQKDLIAGSLKETEDKLQQADQRFNEEMEKLKTNLLETQEKLSLSFVSHHGLEQDLLAALDETELQKRKLCSLLELSAAKDSSLKQLNCKLDALQADLAEQQKLMNQSNEELVCTKEELDSYIVKERELSEEIYNLSEKMLEQKGTLTNQLDILAAKISLKDEEIEKLKVIQENMQFMSSEKESLINESTKLRKELNSSTKTVWDREAEIARLKETRKNLEADLVKIREEMVKTEKSLESTSARLVSADNKCLALEGELKNTVVELQSQVEKTNSLAKLNSHLKEELETAQNVLRASTTQTESTLDDLNSKLDNYSRKETAIEAESAMLLKEMREILHVSRQHAAEKTQPLASEILAILEQSCIDGNAEIEFSGKELAEVIQNNEHVLASKELKELQGLEMFPALQNVVQELQNEIQRRRRIEGSVFELARNVVLKISAKEQEIEGLKGYLGFHKDDEDWGNWFKELLSVQLEFENELSMAMTLTHFAEPQLQIDSSYSTLRGRASVTNVKQLTESWKLIISVYKECTLSLVRMIKDEAAQSGLKFHEADDEFLHSGSWAQRLQQELTQLKQMMKMLLHEVHQKHSALADAAKSVEMLQSSLQEQAEKGKGIQEQISTLQSFLLNSLSALNEGHFNASSTDLHTEMESPKAFMESGFLRLELERASLLAEELNKEIMSKVTEIRTELARWRAKAESALNLNNDLTAQLEDLKLKVKLSEEKENCMEGELRDIREKAKAMEDEASKSTLQLMEAAEMTRHLELQVAKKEEEGVCVQMQMNDLRLTVEVITEKNQDLVSELATANQLMKEEKAAMQISLGVWKERLSLAHDEMQALQSQLDVATQNNQQGMERIIAEKHHLQLELHDWKERAELNGKENDLLRSQLEELLKATEDLQGRLDMAESAKQQFQNSCQRLEADLKSAQDASREREKLLDDALTRLQEGSQHNRMAVEARFQVLYDALMHEDDDDDERAAQLIRGGQPNAENDDVSSIKVASQIDALTSKGPTFLQRAINDDDGGSKEPANPSLFLVSEVSPAGSLKMERGQGMEDSQQEWDHYLELCDSLIRRHAILEKQLETLATSKTALHQHAEGCSGMDEEAGDSENRKRRLLDLQEKGGSRKPLQPIILSQQVAVAITPSPYAKRRRSNDHISTFADQNASQKRGYVSLFSPTSRPSSDGAVVVDKVGIPSLKIYCNPRRIVEGKFIGKKIFMVGCRGSASGVHSREEFNSM